MKRIVILICVVGVAAFGMVGCKKKPAPVVKRQTTNSVRRATALKPKLVKPVKPAEPGTIDFLDARNGFRDVTFGQSETNFTGLVLLNQDDVRHLKIYTRVSDNLSLHDVPIQNIEYHFFNGQLYEVKLRWRLEHPEIALSMPPTTDLPVYCAAQYGTPHKRSARKDGTEFVWRGHKAEIVITELRMPGVADRVKGGWAIAPATSGRMTIRNLTLNHAAEAGLIAQTTQKSDGL